MKIDNIINKMYDMLLEYQCTSEEMAVILMKLSDKYKKYLVENRLKRLKE